MRGLFFLFLLNVCLAGCSTFEMSDSNSKMRSPGNVETLLKYSKITGTFLNFQNGQRISTGVSFSSQEIIPAQKELIIKTYENGKVIETHFF